MTEEHETHSIPLGVRDLKMVVEIDCRRKWVSVKLIIEVFLTLILLGKKSDGISKLVRGRAAKMLVFAMNLPSSFVLSEDSHIFPHKRFGAIMKPSVPIWTNSSFLNNNNVHFHINSLDRQNLE